LRALDVLVEVHAWNREPALAVRVAQQALALEPFRESGYRRLMRLHQSAGDRAEALRVYERCRRLLADELGTTPAAATEAAPAERGTHGGGPTPFHVDITRAVRERGNVLVVRAEDPATDLTIPRGKQYWKQRPEGIFYTPTTGIWQTVWLEPLPARAVEALRLQ